MVALQKQASCIKANDAKCIELTNEIMLRFVATQAAALKNSKMAGGLEKEITEYLEWYESNGYSLNKWI